MGWSGYVQWRDSEYTEQKMLKMEVSGRKKKSKTLERIHR